MLAYANFNLGLRAKYWVYSTHIANTHIAVKYVFRKNGILPVVDLSANGILAIVVV